MLDNTPYLRIIRQVSDNTHIPQKITTSRKNVLLVKNDRSYYSPPKLNLALIPPIAEVTAVRLNRSVAYPAYNAS